MKPNPLGWDNPPKSSIRYGETMAQQTSTSNQGTMTAEQRIRELESKLNAAMAQNQTLTQQLEAAAKKVQVTWKFAEYGKGAISVYGLQRMPVALYPETLVAFIEKYGASLVAFAKDANVANESRARGFAYESAEKQFKASRNRDFDHSRKYAATDTELIAWRGFYDAAFLEAMKDETKMAAALAKRIARNNK